jgi:transcriptional regulator with XRE-family HTH domain
MATKKHTAQEKVAYWVRRYRKERKLTQDSLSKRLGVTRACVPNWELYNSPISIKILESISQILGVHIMLFFQDIPDGRENEYHG